VSAIADDCKGWGLTFVGIVSEMTFVRDGWCLR
jgi:hypothetical protein